MGTSHFVLLLLPPSGVTLNATEAAEIREIEKLLLDRHSTAAVAFSRETRDATVLLERLNRDGKAFVEGRKYLMQQLVHCSGA